MSQALLCWVVLEEQLPAPACPGSAAPHAICPSVPAAWHGGQQWCD